MRCDLYTVSEINNTGTAPLIKLFYYFLLFSALRLLAAISFTPVESSLIIYTAVIVNCVEIN